MSLQLLLYALIGLAVGVVLAWLGRRVRLLTVSGQVAVIAAVTIVTAAESWVWGVLVVLHLVTSGVVILFRQGQKAAISDRFWQGSVRDWLQISARIGWPVVLALLSATLRQTHHFAAFIGALATASADIWSTELGVLSDEEPRLITTRRQVPLGTPGAVSLLGILAGAGAAWLIGFVGLLLTAIQQWPSEPLIGPQLTWLPFAAMLGGTVGSLTDSVLGATAQAIYYCPECKVYTEDPVHTCGHTAEPVRGWPWMTNELIDFVSIIVGAAITVATVTLLA